MNLFNKEKKIPKVNFFFLNFYMERVMQHISERVSFI